MSFARFSSDGFKSDIYMYVNSGDDLITAHIAGNRTLGLDTLETPEITADPNKEYSLWYEQYHAQRNTVSEFINSAEHEYIDDEYAGQTHHGMTISEAVSFVHDLESRGYYIPKKVHTELEANVHNVTQSPDELPDGKSRWEVQEPETDSG